MPTRRTCVALGVGLITSLAGCTVSVENPLDSDDDSQPPEQEPTTESTGAPTEDDKDEPSADFTFLDMAPLDGYQVSVRVEMGGADEIRIVDEEVPLKSITEDGSHRIAGDDDEEDIPLHYEEVEFGKEFYAFAYYEDDFEPTVELANEQAA